MPRQRSEGQRAIDSYVGSRVRLRRTLLGISLKKLAAAVGVTARQIRKYERGSDGISASSALAKNIVNPDRSIMPRIDGE